MAHSGVDAVELELQGDRLGHTLEGEVAVEDVAVAALPHCGGGECRDRVVLDVEEVRGLDVRVALVVARVHGVDGDLGAHGGRTVGVDRDRAAERFEFAADLAHHEVAYGEADGGMHRVDGPGAGGQCCGGGGHGCLFLGVEPDQPADTPESNGPWSDCIPAWRTVRRRRPRQPSDARSDRRVLCRPGALAEQGVRRSGCGWSGCGHPRRRRSATPRRSAAPPRRVRPPASRTGCAATRRRHLRR